MGNIGVMMAAGLIWYNPEWRIADPIATLVFCALVIWTTKALIADILDILMQRAPSGYDPNVFAEAIALVEGVERVTDLHICSLRPGVPILTVHVDVRSDVDCVRVTRAVKTSIESKGIAHSTIQTH